MMFKAAFPNDFGDERYRVHTEAFARAKERSYRVQPAEQASDQA